MTFIHSYQNWLKSKNYNKNTIRNYLADTNKYLNFVSTTAQSTDTKSTNPTLLADIADDPKHLFSSQLINAYILQIYNQKNSKRFLASLSLFCQFAIDQNIISQNPVKSFLKQQKKNLASPQTTDLDSLISRYQNYLLQHKKTSTTIKNYINDIHQYLTWAKQHKNDNNQVFIFSEHNHVSEAQRVSTEKNKSGLNWLKNILAHKPYET